MSAYIRVASANQNITVPQYFQQSVVSATQKNVYYMDGNVGIGQAVPTSKLVVDGNASIGFPTTAAPANGLIVSGSVGIGVANPTQKLEVYGNIQQVWGNYRIGAIFDNSFRQGLNYNAQTRQLNIFSCSGDTGGDITFSTIGGVAGTNDDNYGVQRMIVRGNGYVGIGNTNPQFPLDVGGSAGTASLTANYWNTGSLGATFTSSAWPISIKSNQYVWSTIGFIASSDTRIKTNIQDIDDGVALAQLRLLQPKTYEYIDKVQRGSDPVIGFIAQEVAEGLPRAVTKQKEIIPSIYAIASVSDGVLTLEKEHGLVVGDKVKLIKEQGGEVITTVKEVLSTMSFTVDDTIEDARIFVYGKEVPDFHTLDKNAIFTIGVAAVQELDRQVQSMKSRLDALERR